MTDDTKRIAGIIAGEINAKPEQAAAAIELLDGGATVPFVARYRKEATGGLDDTQLRLLAERLSYLRELEARREAILNSIREQNKLTDELEAKIAAAATKAELEDIYLPYKPKRRTKAEIARELGLGPLADSILADRAAVPLELAQAYVGEKVPDTKAALDGARDILTEQFAENADLIGKLRIYIKGRAFLRARVADGKQEAGAKFSDYFDHIEKWATVPSHRALAMLRGRNEEILYLDIEVDADLAAPAVKPVEQMIADAYTIGRKLPGDQWLMGVVGWTWRVKLSLHFSIELMTDLRERADKDAIDVFARNLKDLLLAPPAGSRATMGLDPGIRTGVKVAVTDATGKVLATTTVYPFPPKNDVRGTQAELATLIRKHGVELIAIGNGTGSRETEKLVAEMLSDLPAPKPLKVIVSEAGASVYSASETAAREFPTLDVSLRGAVSIARRLQDPLAELVKIEPEFKSIGVGQYQHDVDQYRLSRSLEGVVEDAVNAVGVDLNTASAPLLARVSGLGASLADAIVAHRDETGPFANRKELLKVSRLGQRTFEQCAGFLRISNGSEPLDASAVHPEAYAVAKQIIAACGRDVRSIMGDSATLKALDPRVFVNERFGLPTVRDIIAELEKPGRDPRPAFKTATFADGIDSMKDLVPGMLLEGTVTNVAAFGAFVDIGVHQDGLVHVSQLADRFVKEAHEVVKAGDVVKVRVIAVDLARKRISLSMRKEIEGGVAGASARETSQPERKAPRRAPVKRATPPEPATQGALGAALAAALKRKSGARQLRRVVKPRVSSFGCGWLRQRCDRRCSTSTRYGNRKTMPDIFFIIGARMKRFLALLSFAVAMAYGSATSLAAPFVFSNFAHPESEFGTYANDINNNGVVIGYYLNNSGTFGFVKTGNTFATVTHPLASGETTISGINDAGAWVGDYTAAGRIHGYLNVGGTFTSIDNPLAHTRTTVSGINNAGAIVGQYDTADGIVHGFLSQGGAFVTIDIPNTISGTFVTGINDNGAVSGYFNDAAGYHSFVYEGGVFTSIDNPDADVSQGTFATGINNNGHITGLYFNSSGTHGFIDIGGVFTALDDPLANLGTVANGLNDLDQITGYYIGSIRGGLPDAAFVTAFPSADVPLPPTSLLLATGVLALLGVRRGGLGRS